MWSGKQRRIVVNDVPACGPHRHHGRHRGRFAPGRYRERRSVVDLFVMWGGVEIWVPPDWAVSNQVGLLMGGAEDKSTGTQDARHRLVVRGFVLMGGVEIKT